MPEWLDKILKEWPVIRAAPWSFGVAVFVTVCLFLPIVWAVINWAYSSRLAGREGEIKLLERQRDDYKQKLGGASPEQAEALIADLRAEVDLLGKRFQERDIEPNIARQIVDELRVCGSHEIRVTHATGDKSSAKFADTISDLLKRGGWKVSGPKPVYYFGSVFDLSILVGPGGDSDGANLLAAIFKRHGMPIDVNVHQSHENQCDLIVGAQSR